MGSNPSGAIMEYLRADQFFRFVTFPTRDLTSHRNLHQRYEGEDKCCHCGKPEVEWLPMESCPARATFTGNDEVIPRPTES